MALRSPPSSFYRWFPIRDFVDRINWAWVPGLQPTSWFRDWNENIRVGGSTNPLSQHLGGLAADVAGPNLSVFAARARAAGLVAVEYTGHVHVQYWPRGVFDQVVRNA